MSKETHSPDSNSDQETKNYDTWEYGTEPLPNDHTWEKKSLESYQEAAKSDAFLFGEYNAYEAYKE